MNNIVVAMDNLSIDESKILIDKLKYEVDIFKIGFYSKN